jgi:acetylglutamate kinase
VTAREDAVRRAGGGDDASRQAGGGEPWADLTVVKLGGETLGERHDTAASVAAVAAERRLVVVHGGGKRLTGWLSRLGIESRFQDGRRVTDDASLEVAVAVLGGLVNGELVAALRSRGSPAVGLTGIDAGLLVAERVRELGRVARVSGARPAVLEAVLAAGFLPVVAPLATDEDGTICNVNADEVASGLAAALHARLLLLSDTDGVRDADGVTISQLDEPRAEDLIARGVIAGGMVPKVRGAISVVRAGASEVVIADGRRPDALRRALNDRSAGTRIVGVQSATTPS